MKYIPPTKRKIKVAFHHNPPPSSLKFFGNSIPDKSHTVNWDILAVFYLAYLVPILKAQI